MSPAPALDLRGRRFVGARMPLASLSGADLRGADLSGADLRGADLSRIRAGMSRPWTALVVVGSLVLSVAIGAFSGIAGRLLHQLIASGDPRRRIVGLFVAAVVVVLLVIGVWKGLRFATRNVLPAAAALAVAAGTIAILRGAGTGAGALAVLAFLLLIAAIIGLSVLARVLAGAAGGILFTIVAVAGALAGRALDGGLVAAAIAIGAMLMARRSRTRKDEFPLAARVTEAIVCRGGTRLRGADLTGASLSAAHLVACDFRGARLAGARFDGADLRLCRFDDDAQHPVPERRGATTDASVRR
jgi:hypothetical protein